MSCTCNMFESSLSYDMQIESSSSGESSARTASSFEEKEKLRLKKAKPKFMEFLREQTKSSALIFEPLEEKKSASTTNGAQDLLALREQLSRNATIKAFEKPKIGAYRRSSSGLCRTPKRNSRCARTA